MLVLFLAIISLAEPHVFRAVVKQAMVLEAWRNGISLTIGHLQGSVYEPLVLEKSRCTFRSKTDAVTRVEIARADLRFDWKHLLRGTPERWFEQLTLSGVSGKISLSADEAPERRTARRSWLNRDLPHGHWLPLPGRVEARDVNFVVERKADSLRFEGCHFLASELEPGVLSIARLNVKQPWLNRTFREVKGTTKLENTKLLIANLVLEAGVEITSFSAELAELARGRIDLEMQLAAFGGNFHGEAQSLTLEHPVVVEASGTFERIGIAKLATFLGVSDAAGGTIKNGTFRFRGSPRNFEKASASLWLEADHFQWESRQWDSLAFGASLMDRRVRVSELHLHQGHNQLDLSGEMALPMPGVQWWQNEFTCNIAAKIEEMADLSALLLPEFKFAAGRAKIDGSIRGRNQQFEGQLILSGSNLKWRHAPIENLHAAVKLHGNECEISNVEIFNRGDYVRGHGVVNILGATQYWGELRGSIDELATYASILQKPIVPEPLAGGAVVEWSGEGSAKGHSGKFLARLNKLRSLGALATQLHPINADLEASYSEGGMQFSQFTLSDETSAFSAKVDIGNKALALREIRLVTGSQVTLEGNAVLPLDIWRAWPNTSVTSLLNDETASAVKLTATNLDLHRASKLAGWNFPVAGILNGTLSTSGPLAALVTDGKITLRSGVLPLGWSGEVLDAVEAAIVLRGADVMLEQFSAQHRFGGLKIGGTIGFKNVRDPSLQLRLQSEHATFPIFGATDREPKVASPNLARTWIQEHGGSRRIVNFTSAETSLDLTITGALSAVTVGGTSTITKLRLPDVSELWRDSAELRLPPLLTCAQPWNGWKLDVVCRTDSPVPLVGFDGNATVETRLSGTACAPRLSGKAQFSGLQIFTGPELDSRAEATLTFHEDRPQIRRSTSPHTARHSASISSPASPVRSLIRCAGSSSRHRSTGS